MVYTDEKNDAQKKKYINTKIKKTIKNYKEETFMQGFFGRGDNGCGGDNCCWIILLLMLCGGCGGMNQTVDICTLILLLVILGKDNNGCGRTCC